MQACHIHRPCAATLKTDCDCLSSWYLARRVRVVAKSACLLRHVRPSVRPSACIHVAPTGRISVESDNGYFYENVSMLKCVDKKATSWTVRGSNPGGVQISHTRPDQSWGPPSLLYNGYRVYFPGVKRPGRGVNHSPPSSVEVKERVVLYLYSPSGPSCLVLGRNLLFQNPNFVQIG